MAKKDAPWQAPEEELADEATSIPVAEETAVPVEETPVTEEPIISVEPEAPEEMVVARVVQRYTLSLDHHRRVTFVPGNVVMPRSQAEHPYSKASGTVVVGIPDTASVTGFPAKQTLESVKAKAGSAEVELSALLERLNDMTKEQTTALTKARDALKNAFAQLGSF